VLRAIRPACRAAWLAFAIGLLVLSTSAPAAPPELADRQLGFTELRTDLPGGRHANVRTMRAVVSNADGSQPRRVAEQLASQPDTWTHCAGWSPDGHWLLYGSKRDGVRQLFVMRLNDQSEHQVTDRSPGRAAMWAHCRP
jgi:hypothetical protein